jgi:hypothetical protein
MTANPTGNPDFFGQKVSKPGVNVNNAGPTDLVYQNNYTTTTYYDSSNSRILLGQLPDSTYGMWVSLPGVDVTTATSDQLAFDSGFQTLRVGWSQTVSVVVPPIPAEININYAHNLNAIPYLLGTGFSTEPPLPGTTYYSFSFGTTIGGIGSVSVVDLNNINLNLSGGTYTSYFTLTLNLLVLTPVST